MEKNKKKNIDIHLCINITESLLKLTQYYKSAIFQLKKTALLLIKLLFQNVMRLWAREFPLKVIPKLDSFHLIPQIHGNNPVHTIFMNTDHIIPIGSKFLKSNRKDRLVFFSQTP